MQPNLVASATRRSLRSALAVLGLAACLLATLAPTAAAASPDPTATKPRYWVLSSTAPRYRAVSSLTAARLRRAGHQVLTSRRVSLPAAVLASRSTTGTTPASWSDEEYVEPPRRFVTDPAGTLVAVIDTGLDTSDFLFFNRVQAGRNFVAHEPFHSFSYADRNGHGTHVAGIVAKQYPNARLLIARVLDAAGEGELADVAAGIVWAVDQGARVLNVSVSLESFTEPTDAGLLADAIRYAESRDAVVVAAAGNSGEEHSPPSYPAAWDSTLAVAALDTDGSPAGFSTRGRYIDVAAPGVGIFSAAIGGAGRIDLSGSSMAAPHVAALAAELRELHPDWSAKDIRAHIAATAVDVARPGPDALAGYGAANRDAAISATSLLAPAVTMPPAARTTLRFRTTAGGARLSARPKHALVVIANDEALTFDDTNWSEVMPLAKPTRVVFWTFDADGVPAAARSQVIKPAPLPRINASFKRHGSQLRVTTGVSSPRLSVSLYRVSNGEEIFVAYLPANGTLTLDHPGRATYRVCFSVLYSTLGCRSYKLR